MLPASVVDVMATLPAAFEAIVAMNVFAPLSIVAIDAQFAEEKSVAMLTVSSPEPVSVMLVTL